MGFGQPGDILLLLAKGVERCFAGIMKLLEGRLEVVAQLMVDAISKTRVNRSLSALAGARPCVGLRTRPC